MEKDVKCYANVIKTSVMYLQDVVLFLKVYLIFCNRNFIFNYSYTILILTFSDKKLAKTKHVTFKPVKNILIWGVFFQGTWLHQLLPRNPTNGMKTTQILFWRQLYHPIAQVLNYRQKVKLFCIFKNSRCIGESLTLLCVYMTTGDET